MTSVTLVSISDGHDDRGLRHLVLNDTFYVPICRMHWSNETTLRPRRPRCLDGLSCLWCMAILVRARGSVPS